MEILFITSNLNLVGGKERYDKHIISVLKEYVSLNVIELQGVCLFWKALFVLRAFLAVLIKKPDIVCCALINFSPICLVLKKLFGVRYVVFTHGADVWNIKNNLHKKALLQSTKTITVSNFTKDKLIEQLPSIKDKIFLIPNTINEKKFVINKKHETREHKVILTVARLYRREMYKGYDKVIQALPLIKKEIQKVRYVIVGKGSDMNRLKQLAETHHCSDNLIMPGYVSDEELVDYYNGADVFIMPSKGEGFGIVFLEALSCGVPVIAGNCDGSREAVLNGKLGILVNPDNVEEIAVAIIKVLKKQVPPEILDGNLLRKEILEAYGFDKLKKRVIELVHELETA